MTKEMLDENEKNALKYIKNLRGYISAARDILEGRESSRIQGQIDNGFIESPSEYFHKELISVSKLLSVLSGTGHLSLFTEDVEKFKDDMNLNSQNAKKNLMNSIILLSLRSDAAGEMGEDKNEALKFLKQIVLNAVSLDPSLISGNRTLMYIKDPQNKDNLKEIKIPALLFPLVCLNKKNVEPYELDQITNTIDKYCSDKDMKNLKNWLMPIFEPKINILSGRESSRKEEHKYLKQTALSYLENLINSGEIDVKESDLDILSLDSKEEVIDLIIEKYAVELIENLEKRKIPCEHLKKYLEEGSSEILGVLQNSEVNILRDTYKSFLDHEMTYADYDFTVEKEKEVKQSKPIIKYSEKDFEINK